MKQVRGIWLPEYETHLEGMILNGPEFAGKGTYQFAKFAACFPLIKNFRHAIDIGGHVGTWSRVFERCFARVTAFEPVPDHRECFELNVPNCSPAAGSRVILAPFALGDKPGTVHLHAHMTSSAKSKIAAGQGSTGDTHVVPAGHGDIEVQMRTLDSFNLHDIDYLKIDVEGYEEFIVRGGEQTIKREKPVIIVEQKPNHAERYGKKQTDAAELLQGWGAIPRHIIHGDHILSWD